MAGSVVFERNRPQQEMPTYMAAADVLVSPRVQGINPPGKLLSYLASGRPVVATNTLVHNQLLDRECAILTAPTAEGIAQGLIKAMTDEAAAAARGARGGPVFLERYGSKAARDIANHSLFAAVGITAAKRMRMLVVAPQPFFSPRGTPFSVYYRALVLAEQGADIDLLTYGAGKTSTCPRKHRTDSARAFSRTDSRRAVVEEDGPRLLMFFLDDRAAASPLRRTCARGGGLLVPLLEAVVRFRLIYDMHSSLPQQLTNFTFTSRA